MRSARRGNGVGGPNVELVLSAGITLDGAGDNYVLSCDTVGVDGGAEVAGVCAGPETRALTEAAGIDPATALTDNDAHGFFGRLGKQNVTGPTLTNVNDIRAILVAANP